MKIYDYVAHNPNALTTADLFIPFDKDIRKTIYRMPYKNRFNKDETRDYIFEEFMRTVLLDIIKNNTIFVFPSGVFKEAVIHKVAVTGETFEKLYKLGRFNLDYLKSNFTGHFLVMKIENTYSGKKMSRYVYLSGDLKTQKDKASEIW